MNSIYALIKEKTGRTIDSNIPLGYVFALVVEKGLSLIYGNIRLFKIGRYIIHPSTKIKCKSKLILRGG